MSSIIKPKYTATAGKVPTTSDLADGEFCVNVADKIIYQRIGTSIIAISNFLASGGSSFTLGKDYAFKNNYANPLPVTI